MHNFFDRISLPLLIFLCLSLGLAPFSPEPHVLEKLRMLATGELNRLIDIFDLLLHGTPWLFLSMKLILSLTRKVEP